jgi:hypothetical protein
MELPNPLTIPATILLPGVTLGGFAGSAPCLTLGLITTRWSAPFGPVHKRL